MIGKPNSVLQKYKTVIFIYGCVWYRHKNCKYATTPKKDFILPRILMWSKKIC